MNHVAVRALAKKYAPLTLEDMARGLRLGYSEDVFNSLRLAAITAEIRQITGADFSLTSGCSNTGARYQQGQANDPTASLRDDDDDFYKLLFRESSEHDRRGLGFDRHLRCAEYHRALARKASNWQQGTAQLAAADKHSGDPPRDFYPDLAASQHSARRIAKVEGLKACTQINTQ